MSEIHFTVPGEPVGWQRAGHAGHHYTQKKTQSYEAKIGWLANTAGVRLLEGPVDITLRLFYGVPASASKKRRAAMLAGAERPCKKPDADNVLKAVCDALNAVAFKDDVQVCDVLLSKHWAEVARVEITIRPATVVIEQSAGIQRDKAA